MTEHLKNTITDSGDHRTTYEPADGPSTSAGTEAFELKLVSAVLADSGDSEEQRDDTPPPVIESNFAPVSSTEIEQMNSLIAMAAKEEAAEAVADRKAIAEPETKKITRVPVRKVSSKDFYRIRRDPDYRLVGARLIEDRHVNNKGFFLLAPGVKVPASLQKDVRSASIYTGMNHTGDVFLVVVLKSDTSWYDSARDMVQIATKQFIKVVANNGAGSYDYYEPHGFIPEPDWSSLPPFSQLLVLAFRDRIIENSNHKAFRMLLGDFSGVAEQDDRF
jgi:hypothetical protein